MCSRRCDRVSHWCDVHHLVHWADGGETNIENLVLLCRTHHLLVHEGGWTISGKPGRIWFYRPDGTELGSEPPPRQPYRSPLFTVETKRELPAGGLLPMISQSPSESGPPDHDSGIVPKQSVISIDDMFGQ